MYTVDITVIPNDEYVNHVDIIFDEMPDVYELAETVLAISKQNYGSVTERSFDAILRMCHSIVEISKDMDRRALITAGNTQVYLEKVSK